MIAVQGMIEELVFLTLLVGTSIAVSSLLFTVHRHLRSDPFASFWSLFWALQIPLYLLGTLLYHAHLLNTWPVVSIIPLAAFQAAAILTAGDAARGKEPASRDLIVAAAVLATLMMCTALAGALWWGPERIGSAFGAARGFITAASVAYFAYSLRRPLSLPGLSGKLMTWGSAAMALHFALAGLSSLGYGPYMDQDSPVESLVGLVLQFAVSSGIVMRVLEQLLTAANAAAESYRSFRALLESIQLLGLIVDSEGRIEFVNQYLLQVTGFRREDILGQDNVRLFQPSQNGETILEVLKRGIKNHDVPPTHDEVMVTRDGRRRMIHWVNTSLRATGSEFAGCASVGYDMTESREREARDRQALRMESVGRLAGGVAHDFNNHLTVINGYCELLLRSLPADSVEHSFAREALRAGERAGGLTQQLLAFSRRQIMEPRIIAPAGIIRSLHSMLCRLMREDIEVSMNLSPDTGLILCDPSQLEQIIINLAVNARDAITGHGRIVIELSNERVESEGQPDRQCVLIRVTDNGRGMDEATLARAFEPFFTTKDLGHGVGLGLSVVHGIVTQSGGWIRIDSKEGCGTVCSVYFPQAEGPPSTEPAAGTLDLTAGSRNESLLLVEDREDVRQLTASIFRNAGYHVVGCSNGGEAVELIESNGGAFHLLVTDVVMPRMNGRELADWMRQKHPQVKVLFVSGYAPDTVGHEGILDPGIHFLPKPYSTVQLLAKVREILSSAR